MTRLNKPLSRVTVHTLDGSFGPDSDKPLVVTLMPAQGDRTHEMIAVKPLRSRGRTEYVTVMDLYRFALRCRVNRELLEKARARKEQKAIRLAAQRQARAEKRLVERNNHE